MNKQLTYDDTRDLSIKILDKLVENGFVKNSCPSKRLYCEGLQNPNHNKES